MTHDHALDHWLTTRHTVLINALDEVLDLDAGLADATLTAHYTTLTTHLDHVLDLNAGLQNIHPTPTEATAHTTDQTADDGSLTAYTHHLATRLAHERLATRAWFPQQALTDLHTISMAEDKVRDLRSMLTRDRALTDVFDRDRFVLTLKRDLVRERDRDLYLALDRKRDLERDLDPLIALALARALALALDHVLALELDRAHIRDLERTLDLNRVRDLTWALDRAHVHDLAHALAHAHAFVNTHDRVLAHILAHVFVSVDALDHFLVRTRDGVILNARYRLHPIINNDLAYRLADVLACADALTSKDLRTALPQLEQALTDVTGADLTHANLDDVPLDGVLWSSDTRWPSHLQERIRWNSLPIAPDLYRINSSGIDKDTFVDQNH